MQSRLLQKATDTKWAPDDGLSSICCFEAPSKGVAHFEKKTLASDEVGHFFFDEARKMVRISLVLPWRLLQTQHASGWVREHSQTRQAEASRGQGS